MRYISTRGEAPELGFTDALLSGLARDGGLYTPARYPALSAGEIAGFAGRPYGEVARKVITPFTGSEFSDADLARMITEAYGAFRHAAVTPLTQIDNNLFVLELFHGPTLAFKDVAMRLLGRLMDHTLRERGRRATIVGATSGDTGAAAVDAFRGSANVDVFILYPHGRVSDVQRRQMTTIADENVHAVAVEGTFDDCQNILKGLFNHHGFRDEIGLSGVNSINWARIVAQVVYYFTAGVALGAPHRPVSFTVPTGNFGDILAGYIAKRMGLPVAQLNIATNSNDILARTLSTGAYEMRGVAATQSPSMDIQISSNFERLLFDLYDRGAAPVRALSHGLAQSRRFAIAEAPLAKLRAEFSAGTADEAATTAEMARTWRDAGYMLDPHTAVGVSVARRALRKDPATPMVALGTAHPAKFPDAVRKATGVTPQLPLHLADIMGRKEHFTVLANDQRAVENFVRARARITAKA